MKNYQADFTATQGQQLLILNRLFTSDTIIEYVFVDQQSCVHYYYPAVKLSYIRVLLQI